MDNCIRDIRLWTKGFGGEMTAQMNEKTLTSIKLEYPFPLSYTYFSMKNAEECKARLDKCIELLESIVKYLSIISLSSSLRSPIDADHSNFILSFMPRPSLGTWNAALREILSYHHTRPEDLFLPEIYHFYYKANRKMSDNARIIDEFISERNRMAHGGGPSTPKDCEQKVSEVQPKIDELLFNLSFLRDYDLLHLKYSKKEGDTFRHSVKVCMGAFDQFESREITTDSTQNASHMYLYHREQRSLLDLHPFMIYSDKFEGASAQEIFFYNRTQDSRLNYMNYQAGHSFNDTEFYGDMDAILLKLTSYTRARDAKYDEYRAIVADAWKFGKIDPDDEENLRRKRDELGITAEESQKIIEEVKEEVFARNIESLILLLGDDSKRDEAARTIAQTGPRAIPFLINALERKELHNSLIPILTSFKSDALHPLILSLLDRETKDGAQLALKSLSAFSLPVLLKKLEKEEEVPEIEETLVSFGEVAVEPLMEIVKGREKKALDGGMKLVSLKEDRIWERAKKILVNIGRPAAERLVQTVNDPLIGETAALILKDIGREAYDPLIAILTEATLRDRALEILRSFGAETIPSMLIDSPRHPVLRTIVEEFALSFGVAALPYLIDSLKSDVDREFVVNLIRRYPDAYPPLIVPLIGDKGLFPVFEGLLVGAGTAAIAPLVKSLKDNELGEPCENVLAKLPPSEVIQAVVDEIRTRDRGVLSTSAITGRIESHMRNVLKDLGKSKIFENVLDKVNLKTDKIEDSLKSLRDPFEKRAFSLFSRFNAGELSVLIDNLEEDALFAFIRLALITTGEMAVPMILDSVGSKSDKISDQCAIILSDIGTPAVPLLIEAVGQSSKRSTALKALLSIGPPAVTEIAKALIDEEMRAPFVEVLKKIGPKGFREFSPYLGVPVIGEELEEIIVEWREGAVSSLIDGLEDPALNPHCIRILKRIGTKATGPLIDSLKREKIFHYVRDILTAIGPETITPLFEKLRGESGAVQSLLKSIVSFATKKDASSSPVKQALIYVAAQAPSGFFELCSAPKSRELALPLLADLLIFLLLNPSLPQRDENLPQLKRYIFAHDLGYTMRDMIKANKEYSNAQIQEAILFLEV
jgi:hypothetical protein